jgi:hypothetical protein
MAFAVLKEFGATNTNSFSQCNGAGVSVGPPVAQWSGQWIKYGTNPRHRHI